MYSLKQEKDEKINAINKEYNEINKLLSELDKELKGKNEKDKIINTQSGASIAAGLGVGASFLFGGYARVAALAVSVISAGIAFFTESEEEQLKNKISRLKNKRQDLIKDKDKYVEIFEKEKNIILNKIKENNEIDINLLNDEKIKIRSKIIQELKKLREIKPKKDEVDNCISELMEKLKDFKDRLSISEKRMYKAKEYDDQLSIALNSNEKRKIHEKCEYELGESKPLKIINTEKKR